MEIITLDHELQDIDWTAAVIGSIDDAKALASLAENPDETLLDSLITLSSNVGELSQYLDMRQIAGAMQQSGCCAPGFENFMAEFQATHGLYDTPYANQHDNCNDHEPWNDHDKQIDKKTAKKNKKAKKAAWWLLWAQAAKVQYK